MTEWEQRYKELQSVLGIHHSHDHAATIGYAREAKEENRKARELIHYVQDLGRRVEGLMYYG